MGFASLNPSYERARMEIIDILDQDGNMAGLVKSKADVHRDGDWHRAVHVWFVNAENQLLLQRRSRTKENHPGLWDVSVAGHISAGETSIQSALREIEEEIGLIIGPDDLHYQFTVREEQILRNGTYIDREFHDVYFVRKDVDLHQVSFNDGEVEEIKYVSVPELQRRVQHGAAELVPHPEEYAVLFSKLRSL